MTHWNTLTLFWSKIIQFHHDSMKQSSCLIHIHYFRVMFTILSTRVWIFVICPRHVWLYCIQKLEFTTQQSSTAPCIPNTDILLSRGRFTFLIWSIRINRIHTLHKTVTVRIKIEKLGISTYAWGTRHESKTRSSDKCRGQIDIIDQINIIT